MQAAAKNHPDLSEFDYSKVQERVKLHEMFTRPQEKPFTLKQETRAKIEVLNKPDAIVLREMIGNEAYHKYSNI